MPDQATDLAEDMARFLGLDLGDPAPPALSVASLAYWRADCCVIGAAWMSQGGNLYAADGSGHAPTFVRNTVALGGKPSFLFTGSEYFTLPSTFAVAMTATSYTAYVVYDRDNTSSNDTLWSAGRATANTHYLWHNLLSGGAQYLSHNNGGDRNFTGSTAVTAAAHYTIGDYLLDNTNSGRHDGADDGSTNQTRNPSAMDTGAIGGLARLAVTQHFQGNIAEIGFYAGVLTSDDEALLESYIRGRYGL